MGIGSAAMRREVHEHVDAAEFILDDLEIREFSRQLGDFREDVAKLHYYGFALEREIDLSVSHFAASLELVVCLHYLELLVVVLQEIVRVVRILADLLVLCHVVIDDPDLHAAELVLLEYLEHECEVDELLGKYLDHQLHLVQKHVEWNMIRLAFQFCDVVGEIDRKPTETFAVKVLAFHDLHDF